MRPKEMFFRTTAGLAAVAFFTLSSFAQTAEPQQEASAPNGGGWPRASESAPANPYQQPGPSDNQQPGPYQDQQPGPYQNDQGNQNPPAPPNYGQRGGQGYYQGPDRPAAQIPGQLTVPPGTYVTVRVNQMLSSNKNQKGDAFTATLVQPVVVNGIVVAEPGETLGGQVVESDRGSRGGGAARLGVQLTDLSLSDGQQVPIRTQLINRRGPSSAGRDAGAIVGTTAVGAAIGAAADWGRGAAIGAGAGLVASTIGVLVTHGAPSVLYPEQVLTFRIEAPVTFSTERAPYAFHFIQPNEYDRSYNQGPPPQYASAPPPLPPPYYAYPYYSPYYWGPGYWGPGVGVYFGPRFYYHGRYWRR